MNDSIDKEKYPVGECRFSELPGSWRSLLLQGKAKQIGEVVPVDSGYFALFIWSIAIAIFFFVVARNSAPEVIQWVFTKTVWQHLQAFFSRESWPVDLFVCFLLLALFSVAVFGFAEMVFYIVDRFLRYLGHERYGLILEKDYLIIRLPGDTWVNGQCFLVHRDDFKESRIIRRGKDKTTEIHLAYYKTGKEMGGYMITRWFDNRYELNAKINSWKFQPSLYRNSETRMVNHPPGILLLPGRIPKNFYYLAYLFMLASFFIYYAL